MRPKGDGGKGGLSACMRDLRVASGATSLGRGGSWLSPQEPYASFHSAISTSSDHVDRLANLANAT